MLGLYGGQDGGIPLTTVNQMKDAMAEAGAKGYAAAKASEFVVYPQAPHAFHADYRPSYRKEAAEDAFKQALIGSRSTASPDHSRQPPCRGLHQSRYRQRVAVFLCLFN